MMPKLDSLLHGELRLTAMSLLAGVESADFMWLREQTQTSAGNLSVQLDKLEKAGYIASEKVFRGKMPRTIYRITPVGSDALKRYVETLKEMLGESYFPTKVPQKTFSSRSEPRTIMRIRQIFGNHKK